jgi:glyoxylase-like metal-dependent hydrolase (beta-lactamase superfamily II)
VSETVGPPETLAETRVREDVLVFTLGGDRIATSYGANCTAVLGRTAVLLVDPFISPAYARPVEEKVYEKTPVPVRHVVLTHHHTDHALGAGWFDARGAVVHAHRACRGAMAAEHPDLIESRRRQPEIAFLFRDAKAYLPARIFDESLTLDLGRRQVRVLHPGHNHTPGDAVLQLPERETVVCGDLVSSGYHVNCEDADIGNLENGIQYLRSLGARTYVPATACITETPLTAG